MTLRFKSAAIAASLLTIFSLPAAADDVTIRYLASRGGLDASELAEQLGYFKGTGITLKDVGYAQGGPESLFALAGGSVEIGSAATPAILNSIASGNDFVVAYPTNGVNDAVHSSFEVLPDSPIRTIKDLVGKKIAVNTLGAHLDYTIREAFRSAGLPETSAQLVVVPGPQLEQVLRSHQVDVAAFGYWQTTFEGFANKHGALRTVFTDNQVLGDIAGGFTVLRRDWVNAHPEAAKTYIKESARALDYAREHPAETQTIIAEVLKARGENPEVAQYFAGYGVRPGGLPTLRDVQFWIDLLTRDGKLRSGQLSAKDIILVSGASPQTN